ncbi:hypothetical protein [Rhodospirillum sp. A1_3_36]
MDPSAESREGRGRRLLWFAVLYLLSLAAMALVVWGIRLLIPR